MDGGGDDGRDLKNAGHELAGANRSGTLVTARDWYIEYMILLARMSLYSLPFF
jgi:hypothetical protein